MVKNLQEHFIKKQLQKTNKKKFRIEQVLKKKVISYMLNGKIMIIHVIAGLIKKIQYTIITRFHLIK